MWYHRQRRPNGAFRQSMPIRSRAVLADTPGVAMSESGLRWRAMREEDHQDEAEHEAMMLTYKTAVERVLPRLPVKNGVVDIDSIWVETSIPYDLLHTVLRRDDLELPENVERIHLQSRGVQQGERSGKSKRRKRRGVRN